MDEQAPPVDHIAAAAGLSTLHVRRDNPNRCWWCYRPWPCSDRVWADRILALAARTTHPAPDGQSS